MPAASDGASDLSPDPIFLLTRPAAQSQRFADALRLHVGQGAQIVISPLMELAFLATEPDLTDITGLIFTSETGVAAFAAKSTRRDLPAWAVGPRTGRAATRHGFSVQTGPGDAQGLVRTIIAASVSPTLLHVRGEEAAFPVAETLISAGIDTKSWAAYRQVAVPSSDGARQILAAAKPVILPLFSANAAHRATQAFASAKAPLALACISEAVAIAASDLPRAKSLIALTPDEDGMLAAVSILADALQRS